MGVIASLTLMGMGGRDGMVVVVEEDDEVEVETSGLVRQKRLDIRACMAKLRFAAGVVAGRAAAYGACGVKGWGTKGGVSCAWQVVGKACECVVGVV